MERRQKHRGDPPVSRRPGGRSSWEELRGGREGLKHQNACLASSTQTPPMGASGPMEPRPATDHRALSLGQHPPPLAKAPPSWALCGLRNPVPSPLPEPPSQTPVPDSSSQRWDAADASAGTTATPRGSPAGEPQPRRPRTRGARDARAGPRGCAPARTAGRRDPPPSQS